MVREHVAIVGGGFSGALLAVNLLRHAGPRATLIERRPCTARGVAYSTVHPEHLLNVRAANMSAFPDDPDHFLRWLALRHPDRAPGFVPRRVYGDYLDELLRHAIASAEGRLTVVTGEAVDVALTDKGAEVRLADGRRIAADRVAIASGNLPPLPPPGIEPAALPEGCFVADPWRGDLAEGLGPDDRVLVLGTGLTMIDVALLLDASGFAGPIVALSRRGLVPRAHAEGVPATVRATPPPPTALALVRALRDRAREVDWRAAVDELRPFTRRLWKAMALGERARFLRHLRAWWDVHRHRTAPEVARRIAAMRAEGRLEIVAGRIAGCEPGAGGAIVRYRPRGEETVRALAVARIVNATGPQGDLATSREPLLAALRDRGLVRPDALGIGIDVDDDSRAIGADGRAVERLTVVGPMTRGAFWEIVAVPDIRQQVWSVARRLAEDHGVAGEKP